MPMWDDYRLRIERDILSRPKAIPWGMGDAAMTKSSEMNSLDWKQIEIKYRGKPVKGRYNVSDNVVTVAAWSGIKTAQLGILPAERLAQMLLRELAAEGTK
jgi:hypothetical protein